MENKKGYIAAKIVSNIKVASNIYKIKLEGKFDGLPGQFYMLRAWGEYPYLSRPISIYDLGDDYIEFLYMVIGKGTEILSTKIGGDTIQILGPLGNGFDISKNYNNAVMISGGIGIAPFLYLAKKIRAEKLTLLAGFKDEVYCIDELKNYADVFIATEDGSNGEKGFVTNLVEKYAYDVAFVCGPTPMMKAVEEAKPSNEIYLSLEAHMGCGIGACLGCQIEVKEKGILRICKDGPVFKATEVNLDA